jgi:hypothetical protein
MPRGRLFGHSAAPKTKRASGVKTDMTEDVARKHALPRGLVDDEVCAIDETWTGLRLVVRLENRRRG